MWSHRGRPEEIYEPWARQPRDHSVRVWRAFLPHHWYLLPPHPAEAHYNCCSDGGPLLLIILSLIPAACSFADSFSALGNPKRNKTHKAPCAIKRETPGAKTGSRGPTTFIGIPMCCPSNKLTWQLKRLIPNTITRMTANLSFYNYLSFSFCITSSLTWSYMISPIKTWQAIVLN